MMQWARRAGVLVGALLLMALIGGVATILMRTSPGIHPAWFFVGSGVIYTMLVLLALHRFG